MRWRGSCAAKQVMWVSYKKKEERVFVVEKKKRKKRGRRSVGEGRMLGVLKKEKGKKKNANECWLYEERKILLTIITDKK